MNNINGNHPKVRHIPLIHSQVEPLQAAHCVTILPLDKREIRILNPKKGRLIQTEFSRGICQ